ncbi:MAG: hypothetical protein KGI54_15180 [Pseudomonadota bacterium]|nr:hypothetical protein [Pseudomonadota bacterium]
MFNCVFQELSQVMLHKHYGIDLNDTCLCDQAIAAGYIERGIKPYEAINEQTSKIGLERLDKGIHGVPSHEPLNAEDEERAYRSLYVVSSMMERSES